MQNPRKKKIIRQITAIAGFKQMATKSQNLQTAALMLLFFYTKQISAALCTAVTGETAILPLQMRHLVAMNLHFHSVQRENQLMVKFSQVCAHKWASNMLIY